VDGADSPLSPGERARGRRLAITSHPAGMTFRMVFTQYLPTLALVALGASEFQVGLQNAFVFGFIALQLPVLRAVAHISKRTILVAGHTFAVLAAIPLLFYAELRDAERALALGVAMTSFGLVAAGNSVAETVWFPILRGFVEPNRIGRFFGTLRTGWHLALIGFYLLSQWWLTRHPGAFAPLFALGWGLGVVRIGLIARLPERSERTGARIRVSEAFALLRDPAMRAYLSAVAWGNGIRNASLPFVIVMLRRVVGFEDAQVLYTTVALYAGGMVSLYPWGRVVDRVGAVPILCLGAVGQGLLLLALAGVGASDGSTVALMVVWFFALSVLASGFGVADTHLLFELTPPHAPARSLVLGAVVAGLASGITPVAAGLALDALLPPRSEGDPLAVYRGFFVVMGVLQAAAFLPLACFRRRAGLHTV
jgi:predicted MFS family arabinose efflux permease